MTKKLLILALALVLSVGSIIAQTSFVATTPSGHRIQCTTTSREGYVSVKGSYQYIEGHLTIPSSVLNYGDRFYTVESIADNGFSGCSGITGVTLPSTLTSIGQSAFQNCPNITSINIPSAVTSIGKFAFSHCESITSLTIPNGVTSIENSTFAYCTSLASITIPSSVTSFGTYVFSHCQSLRSINLPNSIRSIGNFAFESCTGLTSIDLPTSLTSIPERAFWGCTSLRSVNIPNSVTSIGDFAFESCDSLPRIIIPNSVTRIGNYAFYSCTRLSHITIPNSVTTIGHDAFHYCSSLDTIISQASTPPTISATNAFDEVPASCHIILPCGTASAYSSASGWDRFSNLIELSDYTISVSSADSTMGHARINQTHTCSTPAIIEAVPEPNRAFSHWSDGNRDNPRSISVTQNISLTANFYTTPVSLNYASMDTLFGTVSETNPPTDQQTIGDGTATGFYSPFYNWFRYSTNECLYLASEIGASGIIDTISYEVVTAREFSYQDLKIYMGTTDQNTLANVGLMSENDLQLVYSHQNSTIGSAEGWEKFPLDTPFLYDGRSNLVVVVCRNSSSYTSALNYRYTEAPDMCYYRRSDDNTNYSILPGEGSCTLSGYKANIQLSFSHASREPYTTAELTATPKEGYQFYLWSDRCQDNPRSILLTQDTAVTAYFMPNPNVEYVHDTTIVNNYIHDTTIVNNYVHDTTIVNNYIHDTTIVNNYIHDTTIVNNYIHDTTIVNNYIHDTVFVALYLRDSIIIHDCAGSIHDTIFVHDTVRDCREQQLFIIANNDTMGACAGSGFFPLGSEVQIMAIPNRGFRFLRWSDGNTQNPRPIVLDRSIRLTAIFEQE